MKELLKIKPQRKQRYNPGKDHKSALQWAIADGFTQGVVEMFEDPSDYPNDEDVREAANEVLTYAVCKDGKLDEARNTTTSTDAKIRKANKVSPKVQVIHILRNPPVGLLFGVHGKIDLKVPKPKEGDMEILKQFDSAIVAEFYGGRDVPVQSVHNVYDVVYSRKDLNELLKDAKELSMFTKRDRPPAAEFTWIHLPATNDLSLKLMVRGPGPDRCAEQIQDVISFLRTSWFQVPDQYSKTRIMRPQFKERLDPSGSKETRSRDMDTEVTTEPLHTPESSVAEDTKAEEEGKAEEDSRDVEEKKDSSFVPSSAVYVSAFIPPTKMWSS
ncbi:hypothetical protein KJ359_008177 [Pestalotiopsis sp. 9143b]|nr:hypothetical protein KJ359_008177 [Pestalotiopsis sp. 9143b]